MNLANRNKARNEAIIALFEDGVGEREIARRLELTPGVVSGVIHRHRHYVPHPRRPDRRFGEANPNSKLTAPDVLAIRRRKDAGERLVTLAADYGVNTSLISLIARRKRWAHVVEEAAE